MSGSVARLADNLSGAWAVMRGRPEGLARLDVSLEGFWRSFGAILLVAPFALVTLLSQRRLAAAAGGDPGVPASGIGGAEAVGLVADWLIFPLAFALLARPLCLGTRYVPFIVARNWAAVLISAMVAIVHALHLVGLLPSPAAPFILLVAVVVALRFSYLIARTALDVTMQVALPVVMFDFILSMTIWSAVDRFL